MAIKAFVWFSAARAAFIDALAALAAIPLALLDSRHRFLVDRQRVAVNSAMKIVAVAVSESRYLWMVLHAQIASFLAKKILSEKKIRPKSFLVASAVWGCSFWARHF